MHVLRQVKLLYKGFHLRFCKHCFWPSLLHKAPKLLQWLQQSKNSVTHCLVGEWSTTRIYNLNVEVSLQVLDSNLNIVRAMLDANNVWLGRHFNINLSSGLNNYSLPFLSFLRSLFSNLLSLLRNLFNLLFSFVDGLLTLIFFKLKVVNIADFPLIFHAKVPRRGLHSRHKGANKHLDNLCDPVVLNHRMATILGLCVVP
jgi:hypothetical protein